MSKRDGRYRADGTPIDRLTVDLEAEQMTMLRQIQAAILERSPNRSGCTTAAAMRYCIELAHHTLCQDTDPRRAG